MVAGLLGPVSMGVGRSTNGGLPWLKVGDTTITSSSLSSDERISMAWSQLEFPVGAAGKAVLGCEMASTFVVATAPFFDDSPSFPETLLSPLVPGREVTRH